MSSHFVICCWGASYADFCGRVTIPSLLSPGNLPYLANQCQTNVHIYLDNDAKVTLNTFESMRRLKNICNVEEILIQDVVAAAPPNKWQQMILCHRHFFATVGKAGNALYFSNADYIWSDGALARAYEGLLSGKRLVSTGILRTNKHALLRTLERADLQGPVISLAPRTLVRMGLENLHPEMLGSFYDASRLSAWSSILLWNVLHEGILMRTFHHQCVAARPAINVGHLEGTIDCNVTECLGVRKEDIDMITNSDEMCYFEATDSIDRSELLFTPSDTGQEIAGWIGAHASAVHRSNIYVPFRYQMTTATPAKWDAVARESERIVSGLLAKADHLSNEERAALLGPSRLW